MHADAIARADPKKGSKPEGVIKCPARELRAIKDRDGRFLCLFDDPVIKSGRNIPDNPAHATLIAAREMTSNDYSMLKTLLTVVFGGLQRFIGDTGELHD